MRPTLIILVAMLGLPAFGTAAPALSIPSPRSVPPCSAQLGVHNGDVRDGVYLESTYLQAVLRARMWFVPHAAGGPTEVSVHGRSVDLAFDWHEGGPLRALGDHAADAAASGCVVSRGQNLVLHLAGTPGQPGSAYEGRYTYVGRGPQADAHYFQLLFKGCFSSDDGGAWCFSRNQLRIGSRTRAVEMLLDPTEAPGPGTVLRVAGERTLWVFLPRGEGWAVFKSDWASSEGYQEPDWARPWRVLTPP